MVGLHVLLAFASAISMAFAGIEGTVRAWQRRPRGLLSERVAQLAVVLVGLTIAGGLGLFVGGRRPHEGLHFVYALLALALLPVAAALSARATPRQQGLVSLLVALVTLGVIVRLFATG
jgi:hypothetical protein